MWENSWEGFRHLVCVREKAVALRANLLRMTRRDRPNVGGQSEDLPLDAVLVEAAMHAVRMVQEVVEG